MDRPTPVDLRKFPDNAEPVMVQRRCGGWLALCPPDIHLMIGTEGSTREEARMAFQIAYRGTLRSFQDAADPTPLN